MFDLKPNLLSPEEQLAVDQFAAENERRLEELVMDRMYDPDFLARALKDLIQVNPETLDRMVNLVMNHGDKVINIANVRLDCMNWLRSQITTEAE